MLTHTSVIDPFTDTRIEVKYDVKLDFYILKPNREISSDICAFWCIVIEDSQDKKSYMHSCDENFELSIKNFDTICRSQKPGEIVMVFPPRPAKVINPKNLFLVQKLVKQKGEIKHRDIASGYFYKEEDAIDAAKRKSLEAVACKKWDQLYDYEFVVVALPKEEDQSQPNEIGKEA